MIEIVKHGKVPRVRFKAVCKNCGCVFLFERSDVQSCQREGYWVVCPTCEKIITTWHQLEEEA